MTRPTKYLAVIIRTLGFLAILIAFLLRSTSSGDGGCDNKSLIKIEANTTRRTDHSLALSQTTNTTGPATINEVSSFVRDIIKHPSGLPRLADFPGPRAADKAKLMEQYAALGNISNKTGIATALSFQGGKDVYELFRHTLIDETFGRTNTFQEVFRLSLLAESMGFLSQSQKEAFEFIVQGSNPAFWTNASSYYQDEQGDPDDYLAHACIAAIGLNGSPEALKALSSLKDQVGKNIPIGGIPTMIVQGVYYHRMIEQHGLVYFVDNLYKRMTGVRAMDQWIDETKEGSELWDWAMTIKRIPIKD